MKITVEDNLKEVSAEVQRDIINQPNVLQKALGRTAEFIMFLIKKRTAIGQDSEGRQFPKYTSVYAGFRKSKGRQVAYADLNFTGQMLSNMTQRSTPSYAIIYFANKFQAVKAMGNNNKRKFFTVGEKELQPIMNVFMNEYNKLTNR
jgi:hypothetical protein